MKKNKRENITIYVDENEIPPLKLDSYEKICPVCKGVGLIVIHIIYKDYKIPEANTCNFCNGKRKVDWITEIKNIKDINKYDKRVMQLED